MSHRHSCNRRVPKPICLYSAACECEQAEMEEESEDVLVKSPRVHLCLKTNIERPFARSLLPRIAPEGKLPHFGS